MVENLLRPFSRFARLWHSLTVHIQPIWQHRSAALHLSKLACTLGCLLSHSDTHNNSPFCWRHSFCYLLLQCITRSAPGHKLTLTQPEHPWGITPQMPDLSIVTLFFSIHSTIFLFSKTFQQSFCNLWLGGSHKLSPKQRNELCSARLRKSLSSHLLPKRTSPVQAHKGGVCARWHYARAKVKLPAWNTPTETKERCHISQSDESQRQPFTNLQLPHILTSAQPFLCAVCVNVMCVCVSGWVHRRNTECCRAHSELFVCTQCPWTSMAAKGLLKLCFPFVYPASFQVPHPAADQDGPVRRERQQTRQTDRRLLRELRLRNVNVITTSTDQSANQPSTPVRKQRHNKAWGNCILIRQHHTQDSTATNHDQNCSLWSLNQ